MQIFAGKKTHYSGYFPEDVPFPVRYSGQPVALCWLEVVWPARD